MVSIPEGDTPQGLQDPVQSFVWQRTSSVSARSFVLDAQTSLVKLTHAIVIFDVPLYIKNVFVKDSQTLSRGVDVLISSYMYITQEIINRFVRQDGGTLCFVFKPYCIDKTVSRNEIFSPSKTLVLSAASAFKTFAEQTASSYAASNLNFLLIEDNTFSDKEKESADFLFSLLETASFSKKGGKKQFSHWIKAGSKISSAWNFFNR